MFINKWIYRYSCKKIKGSTDEAFLNRYNNRWIILRSIKNIIYCFDWKKLQWSMVWMWK